MINLKNSELIISAASEKQFPETDCFEIVMCGRSNVGKSSVINAITNHKKLAYVGNTPGKTRLLNFYNIDNQITLVDAPGYGYAKRSAKELRAYEKLMSDYFELRPNLKLALLIIDIRHRPTVLDKEMLEFLAQKELPIIVVANKSDKLSNNQKTNAIKAICEELEIDKDQLLVMSAYHQSNSSQLLKEILEISQE
ncbi:MAG: ribosome biogenesis GTP-binding protein YihA/YsxC [Erysipelotrichaceae bacterium]